MLLQPKLNLRVAQRQILTPGLVQMVSVLALNKLELSDMIHAEIASNPVLEEIDESTITHEELAGREAEREMSAEQRTAENERADADPFNEIDFGAYFHDYLDPGFRTGTVSAEDVDAPSIESFLAKPANLDDHLRWQLTSKRIEEPLRAALDVVLGNLEHDGYLPTEDDELARQLPQLTPQLVAEARSLVQSLDPVGIAARNLQECLLLQLKALVAAPSPRSGGEEARTQHDATMALACTMVEQHLPLLQRRDLRDLSRALRAEPEAVQQGLDVIRTLDPKPGLRYQAAEVRLIEPDVAFVKRNDQWTVVLNDENVPSLRLNQSYRRMMREKRTETEVREYVKERYRSALQLMRNIEQRKNTIVRTCEVILRRQEPFFEKGADWLRPMMIKELAEEIGVHSSTISRAVANKYVHTPQGVFELRYFFSEAVNGPEGADLPLPLLKKRVKKLIDDENPLKPLTDDVLASELQRQGIQVTRRTVAKYREDMNIPSTHERRRRG